MKTVSLELSKQLKEAGYPQETEHYWWRSNYDGSYDLYSKLEARWKESQPEWDAPGINGLYDPIASPTSDEILERLPVTIGFRGREYFLGFYSCNVGDKWRVVYDYYENAIPTETRIEYLIEDISDESLADAAAKMWLYLKKEGLL